MPDIKLYAIVSNEAVAASKGNRGKMGAQLGHAYLHCFLDSMARYPTQAQEYLDTGVVGKVCLKADEAQLHQLSQLYKSRCGVYLVKDAGLTVFPRPMITVLGIGPIDVTEREDILSGLRPWI